MAGRKPQYRPDLLKKGERILMNGEASKYANQYAYAWRNRWPNRTFIKVVDGNNVYVKRTV